MTGSSGKKHVSREESTQLDGRLMRTALLLIAGFLFMGSLPLLRSSSANHNWLPLGLHVVALILAAVAGLGDFSRRFRVVRDWLAFVLVPFLYYDLRFIASGIGLSKKDDRIVAIDRMLFKTDLWERLAARYGMLPLSELLHLAYLSYYPLIAVPPILLYRKAKRHEFTVTVVTIVIAYVLCFSVSVVMPVDGPRFIHGPANAPSGPFRGLALTLLKLFSSRGAAFPSSHVAAAVAATYCALRFQRRVGYVALVATCGLAIGAVYGGLHYATDIIAGVVIAVVAIVIARLLEQPSKVAQEAAIAQQDNTPVKMQIMQQRMAQHARRSRPMRPSKDVKAADPGPPLRKKDES